MDPITTALTAALSAGAATGLTDAAKKAIADGYDGLKTLLHRKFGVNSEVARAIGNLEAKPDSGGRKGMLEEEVKASNSVDEPELVAAAQALLQLIEGLPQAEMHGQIAKGTGIAQAQDGSTASVTITGYISGGANQKN